MAGWKSDFERSGIASMAGFRAVSLSVSSVLAFGEGIIPSSVKSFLNTICGVVSDYLQCVHESVFYHSGREAVPCSGRNSNSFLTSKGSLQAVAIFAVSGGSPGCDTKMTDVPHSGAVSFYHRHIHSRRVLGNHIAGSRIEYLDDSLSRSPLKKNRAGIYEEGDRNQ